MCSYLSFISYLLYEYFIVILNNLSYPTRFRIFVGFFLAPVLPHRGPSSRGSVTGSGPVCMAPFDDVSSPGSSVISYTCVRPHKFWTIIMVQTVYFIFGYFSLCTHFTYLSAQKYLRWEHTCLRSL